MIPFRQEHHAGTDEPGPLRSLRDALPRAYAIVLYSSDSRLGWVLLALALLVPWIGLAGLAGVLAAFAIGWWIGVDRDWLRSGFALFNPLLACSSVMLAGLSQGWSTETIGVLWFSAVLISLALTVGLQGWVASRLGLSAQSVPAGLTVLLLQWCGMAAAGRGVPMAAVDYLEVDMSWLPDHMQAFFQAFSAMVFQPGVLVGMVVFVALVLVSPLGGLMGTVGFVSGACVMHVLGWPVSAVATGWCGFNFVLAGVALGAGYQIPNKASLVLAAAGSGLTAVVAVALGTAMGWFGLAPGALPYNLTVIILMVALRWLPRPRGILRSPWSTLQPEAVARMTQVNVVRFPDFHQPALFLPWSGTRVVTQGFSGDQTHRGAWRHGLDFEAPGAAGSWHAGGGDLREFAVFDTAVHSPVAGWVVAVENSVADNPVGHNNPEHNWGNHVILRADAGFHVMLAHLRQGTCAVTHGQRVEAGTLLGNCGNSGRSPVPHLHIHVQTAAAAGAPTRHFVLKHFILVGPDGGSGVYHLSGVPEKGALLRPANPSPGLHACFSGWLPGRRSFTCGAQSEILTMEFDENGCFRLNSDRGAGTLTLFLSEGVLYASPLAGSYGKLLPLLGILLARVPCMDEPGVHWHDVVAAAPFQGRLKRALHDLCDPFIGVELLHYEYTLINSTDEGYSIVARLANTDRRRTADAPNILRGRIQGRHGVVEISGETCAGTSFHWSCDPLRDIGA